MSISPENWTYTRYKNKDLMAFVSIGADESANIVYYITSIDESHTEHFQEEFENLEDACFAINKKYAGFWDFQDQTKSDKEGGCATCIAH